jgi:SRSO17 transposase
MVSGLDRKNCWTIAEHRGNATPDGLQHLLSRAKWDADAVRDDLRDYVVDAFGDPGAVLVVDLYRPRNYAELKVGGGERAGSGWLIRSGGTEVSA